MQCPCFIVPPHLLRAIAESSSNSDQVREAAHASLAAHTRVGASRELRMAMLSQPHGTDTDPSHRCSPFIPEGVLARLSVSEAVDEATRDNAKRDLEHVQAFMARAAASEQGM